MPNVVLDDDIHRKLKIRAAEERKTLNQLITELLKNGYELNISGSAIDTVKSIAQKEHISADQAVNLLVASYNSKK